MDEDPQPARALRGPFTPAQALVLFVGVAFLFLGFGGFLAGAGLPGAAAAQWLLMAAPLLAAVGARGGDLSGALGLRAPSRRALVGAVCIGLSAWYALSLVAAVQERLAPMPAPLRVELEKLVLPEGQIGAGAFLALALTPGVCEELLCRGVVARSLRARLGAGGAVAISALLFAALHLSPYRFVPQALLGASLGAITLAGDSVVPAMIVHALSNAMVLGASVAERRLGVAEARWLASPVVAASAATLLVVGHVLALRPKLK